MPVPPDAVPSEGFTTWWQAAGAIGLGLGTFVTQVWQWHKGRKSPGEETHRMVLEGAEVADMQPMREISRKLSQIYPANAEASEQLRLTAEKVERALEILEQIAEDRKVERAVRDEQLRKLLEQAAVKDK